MRSLELIAAVLLGFGLQAAETADYKPLMKAAAHADDQLKEALKKQNGPAARTSSHELKHEMERIEAFWSQRGTEDAVTWAANLAKAAGDIGAKADAGDFAGAATLQEAAHENCQNCHKAHRKITLGGLKVK
jgi:hypothetical protein